MACTIRHSPLDWLDDMNYAILANCFNLEVKLPWLQDGTASAICLLAIIRGQVAQSSTSTA